MAARDHTNGITASAALGGRAPPFAGSVPVAAVWSSALGGALIGVSALSGSDAPAPIARHVGEQFHAPRLGGRVVTSFGSFSVGSVEGLVGPTRAMHLDP